MSAGLLHDVHAGLGQRVHLLRRRALAAGDDRAGVAHAASRRRGLAGDEADHRLLELAGLMNAAASCSAVPPISPIMITASVSGSAANSRSASMKLVPISGSPPMPMQVVCPMPCFVSWWIAS